MGHKNHEAAAVLLMHIVVVEAMTGVVRMSGEDGKQPITDVAVFTLTLIILVKLGIRLTNDDLDTLSTP